VAQSTALATESLLINRAQGDNSMLLNCLALLGRAALLQGELTQAHTYFQEALTIAAIFNYATPRCQWQPVLGLVCCYQGNLPEARRLLQESIQFCQEQQEKFFLARNYTYLAEVALATGALGEAEQSLAQSLAAYADPRQVTLDEVERLLIAARLATAQQHYLRAATLFGLAEQNHGRSQAVIAKPMRSRAEAARATVQAALEPASFAEAFAAGQQLAIEEAYATLLASNRKDGLLQHS
jgi:ATP/maltotriose-dependent transcriptional regulator MalT